MSSVVYGTEYKLEGKWVTTDKAAADFGGERAVLLSPACASYDQYRNFEIRGDHFRRLVQALPAIERPASTAR